MNIDGETENKKIKEASAMESYDDENEAMENSPEGSGTAEECSLAEGYLPHFTSSIVSRDSIAEPSSEKDKARDESKERKLSLIKQKWLSLTGRKPRNIPNLRRYIDEEAETEKIEFFGDRRPAEVEKARRLKWMNLITNQAYNKFAVNYGVVNREIRLPQLTEGVWSIRFHPELEYLATGYRNGLVQVRNSSGQVVWSWNLSDPPEILSVNAIKFHPLEGSKLYAAGTFGVIHVFDLKTGINTDSSDHYFQINNIDFNSNASFLAVVGKNDLVAVSDPATLKIISQKIRPDFEVTSDSKIDDKFHRFRVYGLKFHPTDINLFATGGWDRSVKIWDVRVPAAVHSFSGPMICGDALDIHGNTILTVSWVCENSVQLWDFPSGRLIKTVPVQTKATRNDGEFLNTGQFFKENLGRDPPNPKLIALGGGGFNEVVVVKIPDGKVIASFPSYKAVTCLDTCSGYIAYGGLESLIRIGQVNLPKNF